MARKLSDEQRSQIEALRDALTRALPPARRGSAPGIASALVRIDAPTLTDADVERVVEARYADDPAAAQEVAATVRQTLLDAVPDVPGAYTLRARQAGPEEPSAPAPRVRELKDVPAVRRGGAEEAKERAQILALDQRFWINGWLLAHPGAYTLYQRELTAINDVLRDGMLPGDVTRRQLAYQMGGDEKFFEYGSDGFRLLRAMGMEDVIRHRPLPKPDLVYYAPRRRRHMNVLVTENLDPYLDVHDLMYEEGRTSILGTRIHAVVLGGGTPVLEHNRLALLLDTLRADEVEVLYWGDIDRAGLDIMVRLREVLGDRYAFSAFAPAYRLMVERARERFPEPTDNEHTGQGRLEAADLSLLGEALDEDERAYAQAVIDGCCLVPQEILTRRDL